MKKLPSIPVALAISLLSFPFYSVASTPVALQPYLKYAPIKTQTGSIAGTGGMSHSLLILNIASSVSAKRRPAIIASEAQGLATSVVAFDGATGAPLDGWKSGLVRPSSGGGSAYLSGTEIPYPRIIAAFSGRPLLVVTETGFIERQLFLGNYHSSSAAIGGFIANFRHDFTAAHFGGEDYKVHKVGLWQGTETAGWPQSHSSGAQRVTTPALLDINGDGVPEVFSATNYSSAGFGVIANDGSTGNRLWSRTFVGGYAANYLAVGQINTDASFEVVLVNRNSSGTLTSVLDAQTGNTEESISMPGDASYGSAPALADFNGDGFDEIVLATESKLNVVGGSPLAFRTGFPADLGKVWISDSAPLVGDLTGTSAGPEIALSTQVPGSATNGQLHIIGSNGAYILPRQLMEIGGGVTNAIADLDADGRNELIVGGRGYNSGLLDSIWVFDLDRNLANPLPHGPVLWGQFGRNAERCNCSKLSAP